MKAKDLTTGLSICLSPPYIYTIKEIKYYEALQSVSIIFNEVDDPRTLDYEEEVYAIYITDRAKALSLEFLELPKPVMMFLSELKKTEPLSHYDFLNGYVRGSVQSAIKGEATHVFLLGYSFGGYDYLMSNIKG